MDEKMLQMYDKNGTKLHGYLLDRYETVHHFNGFSHRYPKFYQVGNTKALYMKVSGKHVNVDLAIKKSNEICEIVTL